MHPFQGNMAIYMATRGYRVSQVSIADAKNTLPKLIHRAESGEVVHITRRGTPVAVLVSESHFERLGAASARDCWQAIEEWRSKGGLRLGRIFPTRSWMAGETARLAATSLGRNEPALKYLLDSNIVSEPARVRPNGGVLSRLLRYRYEVCIAAPVLHELRYGVSRMPEGVRKRSLAAYLATLLDSTLAVLPYDQKAALWHAEERARLNALGRKPALMDGQIAAVAATNNLALATRNTRDFADFADLRVENWFDDGSAQ